MVVDRGEGASAEGKGGREAGCGEGGRRGGVASCRHSGLPT